jgi:hypothetical protein
VRENLARPTPLRQQSTELLAGSSTHARAAQVSLVDLLDRLLQGGIVIQGDIVLSAADIDLVNLDLRLVIGAVDTLASR